MGRNRQRIRSKVMEIDKKRALFKKLVKLDRESKERSFADAYWKLFNQEFY